MKFKVNKDAFGKALSRCVMIVPSRAIVPATEYVHIEKKGLSVEIRCDNMAQDIISTVTAEGNDDGAVCIPAKILCHTVNMIREDSITIHILKNKIEIRTSSGKYSMATIASADFMTKRVIEDKGTIVMHHKALSRCLEVSNMFVNPREARTSISGISISTRGTNIIFEGTNGRGLARAEAPFITGTSWRPVIVPKEFVRVVQQCIDSGDVKIKVSDRMITAYNEEIAISSVLVDDTYPDFGVAFFAKRPTERVRISKGEIEEGLRRIKPFLGEGVSSAVVIGIRKGGSKDEVSLVVSAEDVGIGNAAHEEFVAQGEHYAMEDTGLEFESLHKICATNNDCATVDINMSDTARIVFLNMENAAIKEYYCLGKIIVSVPGKEIVEKAEA